MKSLDLNSECDVVERYASELLGDQPGDNAGNLMLEDIFSNFHAAREMQHDLAAEFADD